MAEPMSDERLAEIQRLVTVSRAAGGSAPMTTELLAEIDRLRAELAARPEPIGYLLASPDADGGYLLSRDDTFNALDLDGALEVLADLNHFGPTDDLIVALVPIPTPEGL